MLDTVHIASEIFVHHPNYKAGLLEVHGLQLAATNDVSDKLLTQAESHAAALLEQSSVENLPHIAQWREAYVKFGAKPQRTRNSLEALTRRAASGLPRVNLLTDVYNALSVIHQIPLGGEDLDFYVGSPKLTVANGSEEFETVADGQDIIEHPESGEIVWVDDMGVTCRRWNWRQCTRTRLRDETTNALFIFDALEAVELGQLQEVMAIMQSYLENMGSNVTFDSRIFSNN